MGSRVLWPVVMRPESEVHLVPRLRMSGAVPLTYVLTYMHTYIHTYIHAYLLTYSMGQSHSWEANGFQVVKKFPAFYGTWRFITAFTINRHLSLSWASSIQYIPHSPLPEIHHNIIFPSTRLLEDPGVDGRIILTWIFNHNIFSMLL